VIEVGWRNSTFGTAETVRTCRPGGDTMVVPAPLHNIRNGLAIDLEIGGNV